VKLYRKMEADIDGMPVVGSDRNMLGVRPRDPARPGWRSDVRAAAAADPVGPGEGLSVFNAADAISPHMGGQLYSIEADDLPTGLVAAQRGRNSAHYQIEPNRDMTLAEFQELLADTRDLWEPEP
jgi:hypothetical protein